MNELRGYQVDNLGRARDRMADQENPPEAEELEQFQRDIQERMPAAARVSRTRNRLRRLNCSVSDSMRGGYMRFQAQ